MVSLQLQLRADFLLDVNGCKFELGLVKIFSVRKRYLGLRVTVYESKKSDNQRSAKTPFKLVENYYMHKKPNMKQPNNEVCTKQALISYRVKRCLLQMQSKTAGRGMRHATNNVPKKP